jgi:cytochrome d ubiquinol oxidase subunit I
MDVVLLSRIQFALTIMFHYLFPPLTIGMGVVLVYLEAQYLRTNDRLYEKAAKFWTKIFALNFAIGVASGIVMEFQFGTNWAIYSEYVGDVFGSALAAEGIFAFFLESGFLAVLVFGWDRVSPKMHFFATIMVALGSIFSSIWIVVANSWQQTPAGFHMVEHVVKGQTYLRAEVVDFWAVVFNPSTMHRLVHVWIGAFILGAFFIMSISAYYLIRRRHEEFARRSFTGALIFATISSLAMLVSGHLQANNVYEHQPAKLAAFEGLYESTEAGAPLYLFGWPDDESQTVKAGLAIPGGLSFLLFEDFQAPVKGLAELEADYGRPPVWLTFQTYHIMVALGFFFIGLTLLALVMRWRGTLFKHRWLMWVFVFAVIGPFIANQFGWVAAEVGRQPWIVYPAMVDGQWVDGLRTSDAVSPVLVSQQVLGSIIMFGLIYLLLFAVWIYILNDKIHKGPEPVDEAAKGQARGFLDAAAERTGRRASMTQAKDQTEQ